MMFRAAQLRARPEGGGDFAPALGGGSGAKRGAGTPHELCEASL